MCKTVSEKHFVYSMYHLKEFDKTSNETYSEGTAKDEKNV